MGLFNLLSKITMVHLLGAQEAVRLLPAAKPIGTRSTVTFFIPTARSTLRSTAGRIALRGLCSCYHRIRFERSLRGTLKFDAVRQSVPRFRVLIVEMKCSFAVGAYKV